MLIPIGQHIVSRGQSRAQRHRELARGHPDWIGPTGAETIQPLPDGRLAVGRLAVPQTTLSDAGAGIRELIGLIESGERVSSSSGEDGRRTLSILLGMLQSADAGGTRVPFPVEDR